MNGLYNGELGQSHRARIPATNNLFCIYGDAMLKGDLLPHDHHVESLASELYLLDARASSANEHAHCQS